MKVIIRDTCQEAQLTLIDSRTQSDYAAELIGQWNGWLCFAWDATRDAYICSQTAFEFWKNVFQECEQLEERIQRLCRIYGTDAVYDVIEGINYNDLLTQIYATHQCLDAVFGTE